MKQLIICALGAFLLVGCSSKAPSTGSQQAYVLNDHEEGITSVPGSEFNRPLIASVDDYTGTRAGGDCSGFITVLNDKYDDLFSIQKICRSTSPTDANPKQYIIITAVKIYSAIRREWGIWCFFKTLCVLTKARSITKSVILVSCARSMLMVA